VVTNFNKVFSDHQPCHMVKIPLRFRDHFFPHHQGYFIRLYHPSCDITLMMGTDMVPETSENFNHVTWLMVREDFV
jgi:hypothetical protein